MARALASYVDEIARTLVEHGQRSRRDVEMRAIEGDAAAALEDLNEAYRRDTGSTLTVVSSYRTTAQQALLVEEKGDLAAAPGTSNHGRGLAIDVAGSIRSGRKYFRCSAAEQENGA